MSEKSVEIPAGISARQEGSIVYINGAKGELSRDFKYPRVSTETKDGKVKFISADERKRTLAVLGTFAAHVKNMIIGVSSGWEVKLKIVYSHFPMKIVVSNDEIQIQNFMGERNPRKTRMVGRTKIDVKKDEVVVTGIEKDDVGQTAANIELLTKISGFDKRVFQDGCYTTQKCRPAGEKQA